MLSPHDLPLSLPLSAYPKVTQPHTKTIKIADLVGPLGAAGGLLVVIILIVGVLIIFCVW